MKMRFEGVRVSIVTIILYHNVDIYLFGHSYVRNAVGLGC